MGVDIRTLAIILGITHFIQIIVFLHQYRLNKVYQGIGWWLLWSAAEMIGFFFILFREIPSLHSIAIIGQNTLIVSGTLFLYIGVMRFLDQKENRKVIYSLFAGFIIGLIYFLYVKNDYDMRSVIICATLAIISFLTAYNLFKHKTASISASANFNSVIFLVHGGIFLYRAGMMLFVKPVENFFTPTLFNAVPYLDALIVSLLWTFGFIIMVNQRLNADMTEAKEHFEEIFNTSPDGALITGLIDGIILDVNKGFTALTGYTRDESVGKSSLEINLWKNPDERRKVVNELREKGICENFEAVFLRKDGTELIGLMSAKLITLRGNPHIISITRDITGRKQAEEAIRSLSKFPSENPFPVLRLGQDGTVLYANEASEVLLKTWKCSIGERVPNSYCETVKEVLANQTTKLIEIELGERTFSFVITPISDLNYVNLYGSDITERKRAEDNLKRMVERLDLSTRAGRMGVWDWDVQKNQLIWDDRMYELYGIEKQNFAGAYEAWLNGIHPDDTARCDVESKLALSGEKEYDTEFRVVWPDKTVRYLKAYAQVVRDSDGKPLRMTGINYDITEQILAEDILKSLLKEKEVLIREVHHRVKNNFAVVSSLLSLQSRDIPDKNVQEMFMKSRDRIKSMTLIHERLYQSKDLTHINLAEYIKTLAVDLYQAYGADPATISIVTEVEDIFLDVDKAIPCGLVANELISNALKYGFPKNRTDKGKIKVTLHQINENEIELAVMDNGIGLPEDFNIHQTQSLGLKLVSMLAEGQLGGKLKVSGKGGAKFQMQFALQTVRE